MKNYPNEEALRKAHRTYLDAMRPFIIRCLKKIQGQTLADLIRNVSDYELTDDIEILIDINNIPLLLRNHWHDIFSQEFNADLNVQNRTWLIVEGRNLWAHPRKEDVDPEDTRTHLSLAARVLGEIKNSDAKQAVEAIRDQLFSDEVEEHPLEAENADLKEQIGNLSKQLNKTKKEKNESETRLQDVQKRLEELEEIEAAWMDSEERATSVSNELETAKTAQAASEENCKVITSQLEESKAEKSELEESLETTSNELKGLEAEWLASEERLKNMSKQLKDSEKAKTELEGQLKSLLDQLEVVKLEYEGHLKTASEQLTAIKAEKTEIEEHFETTSKQFKKVNAKLIRCQDELEYTLEQLAIAEAEKTKIEEDLAEIEEHSLLTNNMPDSVIFQETTFTKYMNKYYVAGHYINQAFWRYWHAQGRDGKKEMRNAGWSVEKINDNWELEISPENFQAWIENKKLTVEPTASFHERVEEPVLVFLMDRKEHRRVEIINLLAKRFLLNEEARSALSNSGRIEKHLMSKGLIERTRTGHYRITAHGYEVASNLFEIDIPF